MVKGTPSLLACRLNLLYIIGVQNSGLRTQDSGLKRDGVTRSSLFAFRCICIILLWCLLFSTAYAQKVVDKMVATVESGGRVDLITYSDLLWQIALEHESPLENPNSAELNRVLNLIINQRLILQEAEKLPAVAPTAKEIEDSLGILYKRFPSRSEFETRINKVGLSSDQLRDIVRLRLVTEKYLNFRFRSFVIVTPQEVADYYRDVYLPHFRRNSPGRIVPTLEESRDELEKQLTEDKIESDIDKFIESARERAEITILSKV
jgi:hypothetical protein